MVNWNCCSALCTNSHRTVLPDGSKLKYYKLPRDKDIQQKYISILKTSGINFQNGYICSQHWGKGHRESTNDLPDIPVPPSQLLKLQESVKTPTSSSRKQSSLKRKLDAAERITNSSISSASKVQRKSPGKRIISTPVKKPKMRPRQLSEEFGEKTKLQQALKKIKDLEAKVTSLEKTVELKTKQVESKEAVITKLKSLVDFKDEMIKKKAFTYDELQHKPNLFKYMCGLTIEQFDILWNCIQPYVSLIVYDESASSNKLNARSMDQKSELLAVLTCCKHGLDLGISGWMAGISESSMQRLYSTWITFLASLFNCIDLKPAPGFLQSKMPKIFLETGHHLTDQLGDCTEFKLQGASNLDLNTLTFSDYKNTTTAKAYVGIAPHSGGLVFSDL